MDDEPLWLNFEDVAAIHGQQLTCFGGFAGFKDENLVHSALAVPRNTYHYDGQDDILALAIDLCMAIARNHGFNDGNKRTGAVALIEFLAINGWDLIVPDDESKTPQFGQWIEKAVAGHLSNGQLHDRLIGFVHEAH